MRVCVCGGLDIGHSVLSYRCLRQRVGMCARLTSLSLSLSVSVCLVVYMCDMAVNLRDGQLVSY